MEHTTADRIVARSKLELGFLRRPQSPLTNAKIFELEDDFDSADETPAPARTRFTDTETPRFPMLRRGVALASDALVLTLASPFFAAWLVYRGMRALWRRAIPAANESKDA